MWEAMLAISTFVMALAIIASAFYAANQLHHLKKTRYSTLLMDLTRLWECEENIQSRQLINRCCEQLPLIEANAKLYKCAREWDGENSDEFYKLIRLANFFENAGFLVCGKDLDRKDILDLLGSAASKYWSLLEAVIKYQRTERVQPQPDAWEYFECLAKGCTKEDIRRLNKKRKSR